VVLSENEKKNCPVNRPDSCSELKPDYAPKVQCLGQSAAPRPSALRDSVLVTPAPGHPMGIWPEKKIQEIGMVRCQEMKVQPGRFRMAGNGAREMRRPESRLSWCCSHLRPDARCRRPISTS